MEEDLVKVQEDICKICEIERAKYTCPKCWKAYCSVICYKAEKHLQCSEAFYQDCVLEEMKVQEDHPEKRKRMMDILSRMHQEMDDDDDLLDSDDEREPEIDLSERLAKVDLNDADSVWEKLTDEEKREFEELVKSGDVSNVVPTWIPWWSYRRKKELVEDVTTIPEPASYVANCPPVKHDILPFSKLSKTKPSPCVKFGLINILCSYAYVMKLFNGDIHGSVSEAINAFVQLCGNLSKAVNYETAEVALQSAIQEGLNSEWLAESQEFVQEVKKSVKSILEGPEDENADFYVLSSLSDIHRLLSEGRKLLMQRDKGQGSSLQKGGEFSKKYPNQSIVSSISVPKDKLKSYIMKIEFYIAWVKDYGHELRM